MHASVFKIITKRKQPWGKSKRSAAHQLTISEFWVATPRAGPQRAVALHAPESTAPRPTPFRARGEQLTALPRRGSGRAPRSAAAPCAVPPAPRRSAHRPARNARRRLHTSNRRRARKVPFGSAPPPREAVRGEKALRGRSPARTHRRCSAEPQRCGVCAPAAGAVSMCEAGAHARGRERSGAAAPHPALRPRRTHPPPRRVSRRGSRAAQGRGAARSARAVCPHTPHERRRGGLWSVHLTCCLPGSEAETPGPSAPHGSLSPGPPAPDSAAGRCRRRGRPVRAAPTARVGPRRVAAGALGGVPALARLRCPRRGAGAEEEPPAAPAHSGARPERGDALAAPLLLSRSCPVWPTAAVSAGGELSRPLPPRFLTKASQYFRWQQVSPNTPFCFHSYSCSFISSIDVHLASNF